MDSKNKFIKFLNPQKIIVQYYIYCCNKNPEENIDFPVMWKVEIFCLIPPDI